jgi:hypothetical protein
MERSVSLDPHATLINRLGIVAYSVSFLAGAREQEALVTLDLRVKSAYMRQRHIVDMGDRHREAFGVALA